MFVEFGGSAEERFALAFERPRARDGRRIVPVCEQNSLTISGRPARAINCGALGPVETECQIV